ncbi:ferredoxin [Nocardioides sp. cx-169]|uniref:ferredoxin n=1 Tax=Nocardioides sp. cx-169 TaxID=2899080 RepID=UPI001E505D02|nr:ferredoxin [Nocardioides sp. cx-169]MCD4533644.1 ferredoxin [Nocardioides sp. cx-169]
MPTDDSREIRIDRGLCMGSAQCCWYAPGTFDQDDSTVAIVIDPQGDPEAEIRAAIEACPTQAISLVRADAGQSATD